MESIDHNDLIRKYLGLAIVQDEIDESEKSDEEQEQSDAEREGKLIESDWYTRARSKKVVRESDPDSSIPNSFIEYYDNRDKYR